MPTFFCGPSGPMDAKIAIIGEQPGKTEVRSSFRRPFVGPAGRVLDDCLAEVGLTHSEVFMDNVIRDLDHPLEHYIRLERGKASVSEEGLRYIENLKNVLTNQISPNVVVACGNVPLYALTGLVGGITKWRGSVLESTLVPGLKVVPTCHPATVIPPKSVYLNKYLITFDLRRAVQQSETPELVRPFHQVIISPSFDEAYSYLLHIKQTCQWVDFDIEVSMKTLEMTCISFCYDPSESMSIPFVDENGDYFTIDQEARLIALIAEILQDQRIAKCGQNLAFDSHFLMKRYGIKIAGEIFDTMIAQKIAYPDFPAGLDFICSIHTDIPYYKDEGKKFIKVGGSYKKFWTYNGLDSMTTSISHPKILQELTNQSNLETYDRQRRLIKPLIFMAETGILVDVAAMERERIETEYRIKELEAQLATISGEYINAASSKQIITYFKKRHNVDPYTKRTAKGSVPTMDEDALKRLSRRGFEEARIILDIREQRTRLSRYLNSAKVDNDSRYRSSYNPVGTKTGRLSSSENIFDTGGNQQNWPHDLLRFFKPDPGYIFYSFDLSQIENRIVAYVGRVIEMIHCFETGQDLHRLTSSLIFNKKYEEISDVDGSCSLGGGRHSERFWGKKANHGLNYDLGYRTFALYYEIPETEAKWIVEKYHRSYPGVRGNYHTQIRTQLAKDRTITNLMGRKRVFYDEWGDSLFKEAYAQIPQSTTADVIDERALEYIYYNQTRFKHVTLLNQIHDSVGFQMPLSIPWQAHAEALWAIKTSLETPLVAGDREFIVPADLTIGFSLFKEEGFELKHKKFPKSIDALADALHNACEVLREKTLG